MKKKRPYYYDEGTHGRALEEAGYAMQDVIDDIGEILKQSYLGRLVIRLLDLMVANDRTN